jgi:hypothetical protein
MFGSEIIQSKTVQIDVDPGSTGTFFAMRAPTYMTVIRGTMLSKNTQNDGTATLLALHNFGTAGGSIKSGSAGTVVAALGGTAVASILTANVPSSASPTTAGKYIESGEHLFLAYTEQGTGWIAGDRLVYQIDYIEGKV